MSRSEEGRIVHLTFDGQAVSALEGWSVAAALLAAERRAWRTTSRREQPRGLFCGMGVCFDCLVRIDGRANVLACQTPVAPGMCVETQRGAGAREVPE
jgi:predicted molibdopterin-dependent oxidoreductase YjgC